MPAIHVPEGETHTDKCDLWCNHTFAGWLVSIAPDVLWFYVQDVGCWSGNVYGVGVFRGDILIYEGFYGSCSGCGAWGEGGEPGSQQEVLANSSLFNRPELAIATISDDKFARWGTPDKAAMITAIEETVPFLRHMDEE